MADGRTNIANLALNHIGEPPIMKLIDRDNATARIVLVVFDAAIRELGRDHAWNCLEADADIPRITQPPLFGFQFRYLLPTDFIRLLTLNGIPVNQLSGSSTLARKNLYKLKKRDLHTDAEVALISYVSFETDTTIYDAMFVEALSVLIASKIAIQIRQDEQLALRLFQQYKGVLLPAARKVDGNERRVLPFDGRDESRSLASRRTGTRNGSIDTA